MAFFSGTRYPAGMLRNLIITAITSIALALGLIVSPVAATSVLAAQPTAIAEGGRILVTIPGKKPSRAALVVAGSRYPLKRKGKVWRTKPLSADALAVIGGAKAKIKLKVKGKAKTLRTTVRGSATPPPTPGPGPGPGSAPLFVAPGVDRDGDAAYQAVKDYFLNSTLTDCPAGWGVGCSVEQRYGIFADGTQWYCRLTPTADSDIRSVGNIVQVLYAAQKADGAWRVDYAMNSYGDLVYYSVNVTAAGAGNVLYWGPGADPNGAPTDQTAGLQWIRGAKDCSY
jgi:hypothetical protein